MNDLTFTTQSSFLHHGIEGQKWGVRNGPPYPLDSQNAKRIVKEKKQVYKAIKNDYFKSAPGKIRNITPIVASLFGISASEDISGLINSIAEYLSTPKEERSKIDLAVLKESSKKYAAAALSAFIIANVASETLVRATGSKEIENILLANQKEAKAEYKKAKQYVKLATNDNLTKSQLDQLAKLKNELKLK